MAAPTATRTSAAGERKLFGLLLVLVAASCGQAGAQRVQLPTPSEAAPPQTFASPGAAGTAFSSAAPVTIGPPAFDPYSGGALASPSPVFGQSATLGPPQPYAAPQSSLFAQPPPIGWEPGTYSFEGVQTSGARFTKFVQKLDGEYTHLFGGGGARDLELNRVEITSTFAWPLGGNLDSPVLLTPGFAYNDFDDSAFIAGAGFPNDEFDAFLDAAWFPRLNEVFSAELGARTGVWTDFSEVNSDSVRILGRGVAVFRVTPKAELLAGVVYLDRERIKLLPVMGVRWRPTDNLEIDAVFPSPTARRRLRGSGPTDWWVFVAGEYGGGSWTDSEAPTGFDYNDIRVSLGLEFQTPSRVTGRFEVGYVFEREFYLPGAVVTEFEDTVMLRAGINL